MKKLAVVVIFSLILTPALFADAATYKAKCQMCHGADGKKQAKADLTSDSIKKKADADLVKFLGTDAKHNFTKKGLSDDQLKSVVTFIKAMK